MMRLTFLSLCTCHNKLFFLLKTEKQKPPPELSCACSDKEKTVSDLLSETVIITYYRGTTQFGSTPSFACTIIHS